MRSQFLPQALVRDVVVLTMIWYFLVPAAAEAYVGIAAGACMMQAMLAFALTGSLGFKTFWKFFLKFKNSQSTAK
jgi:hypothetical protein